jgi:hypothetical protein
MKILNFELEDKIDQNFDVKVDGQSHGDSPEAQKPYLDPLYHPY